jgi:hypothetical protein
MIKKKVGYNKKPQAFSDHDVSRMAAMLEGIYP